MGGITFRLSPFRFPTSTLGLNEESLYSHDSVTSLVTVAMVVLTLTQTWPKTTKLQRKLSFLVKPALLYLILTYCLP